ncbi:MAG: N-acetyl-gamma-glutamyl-phosphate reductase, partial [Elusimicrobiota bacterium]
MKNIAIIGASGYTGRELVRILLNHPEVKITHVTSESNKGKAFSEFYPEFRDMTDIIFESFDADKIAKDTDLAFLGLPHGASLKIGPVLYKKGIKVVDLSGDFRLKDVKEYEKWYKIEHTETDTLKEAVYGLPELFRDKIKKAKFIANPGCYATSMILAIYPLLKEGIINPKNIVVDAKSGVSGAGKKLALTYLYNEANENFM